MISRCSILYRCVEVCSVYFDYCFQALECGKSVEHLRTLRSKARHLDPAIRGATEKYRSYRMENSLNSACSKTLTDRVLENRSLWSAETRLPAVPLRPFGTSGAARRSLLGGRPRRRQERLRGSRSHLPQSPVSLSLLHGRLASSHCAAPASSAAAPRRMPGARPRSALRSAKRAVWGNGQAPPPRPSLTAPSARRPADSKRLRDRGAWPGPDRACT